VPLFVRAGRPEAITFMQLIFVGAGAQARLNYVIVNKNGHSVPYAFDRKRDVAVPWPCTLFHNEGEIETYARHCDGFLVCIANDHGDLRVRYSHQLESFGLTPVSAIHPSGLFCEGVRIGKGLQAMPRVVVNNGVLIGDYCLLNTNCTIDHECQIGNGVHVMGAAALAGGVKVGNYSTIGTNATILPNVRIGQNVYVGAGAVVNRDVGDNVVVVGVPAKVIRAH
jgi:sugar O-acyltransferase (sialic acid O-acetyltransferase NeuD family)